MHTRRTLMKLSVKVTFDGGEYSPTWKGQTLCAIFYGLINSGSFGLTQLVPIDPTRWRQPRLSFSPSSGVIRGLSRRKRATQSTGRVSIVSRRAPTYPNPPLQTRGRFFRVRFIPPILRLPLMAESHFGGRKLFPYRRDAPPDDGSNSKEQITLSFRRFFISHHRRPRRHTRSPKRGTVARADTMREMNGPPKTVLCPLWALRGTPSVECSGFGFLKFPIPGGVDKGTREGLQKKMFRCRRREASLGPSL